MTLQDFDGKPMTEENGGVVNHAYEEGEDEEDDIIIKETVNNTKIGNKYRPSGSLLTPDDRLGLLQFEEINTRYG